MGQGHLAKRELRWIMGESGHSELYRRQKCTVESARVWADHGLDRIPAAIQPGPAERTPRMEPGAYGVQSSEDSYLAANPSQARRHPNQGAHHQSEGHEQSALEAASVQLTILDEWMGWCFGNPPGSFGTTQGHH